MRVLVEVPGMPLTVETPTPPDLTNRPLPGDVDPADVLDGSNDLRRAELDDLGRAVVERLADAYLDWGEANAGEADWSEETFGDESPLED